jgi:cystine transport system ATP-binding protein
MSEERPVEVEVFGLRKTFNGKTVLDDVDFEVRRHEVVALIGPSGSGKSTLLRCLNLLEMPNGGTIRWEGRPVEYQIMSPAELSRHRTHMGMVFQHFHLFPHRNALDNVLEGPRVVLGQRGPETDAWGRELLDRVGLADREAAWPSELSGGQRQRVAIARALAMRPKVLLLDEITSALDVEMVAGINDLLTDLAREGMTMVVVTHDLAFAREVAHRISFLDEGRIHESGPPEMTLDRPRSERLREFLGACRYPLGNDRDG